MSLAPDGFMSGSFNLRSLIEPGKEHPLLGLRRCFPGKFVVVESFSAVGEGNSIEDIGETGNLAFDTVRRAWNDMLVDQSLRKIREKVMGVDTSDKPFERAIDDMDLASISRSAKIAQSIRRSSWQFIFVDYLVLMAMQGLYLEDARFTGASAAGYSQFLVGRDGEEEGVPCQIMSGEHDVIRMDVRGRVCRLLNI